MIINVYKPRNWTSFDVVAKLRSQLMTKKIGHAGTLDPLAEGVLIVLTDADTKKQDKFMHLEKEYKARIIFGLDSPTYDLEGPLKITKSDFDIEKLRDSLIKIIPHFIGEIEQKVPVFSAVKVEGKRLYKAARSGNVKDEKIPSRKVNIYNIKTNSIKNEELIINGEKVILPVAEIMINCSSGTYIRSLAHDLGAELNTNAILGGLVRTKIGAFHVEDSKKLQDISS